MASDADQKNFGDHEQIPNDPLAHEHRFDKENAVGRNPHPDFASVENSRPDWNHDSVVSFTKTKQPSWKLGQGANDNGQSLEKAHVEIDPYAEGRPAIYNYKLLISGIAPRPIGFISTISEDGSSTNLAPFSYFQLINHDPPLFTIGFAGGYSNAKDTLRNLVKTRECTINIISEHYVEAANGTSINAPYGISEWALSGLHSAPCLMVRPSRVREAIFSVEAKLVSTQEFESKVIPGKKTGVLAIVEGVRFWVREDAINEDQNLIDPTILRPIFRLGGITYGRVGEVLELPRPEWKAEQEWAKEQGIVKAKGYGQQTF